MLSEEEFDKLVSEIRSLGHGEETSFVYAAVIGDKPVMDDKGNVVVTQGGEVVARLKLKFFEE